jgi:mono-ADP-ribosyltransferase sirtuin 6
MSASYASRLSVYPNKGVCGLPERFDSKRVQASKIKQLARLMKQKNVVVLTGAGISTAAGVPDFRGPNGVWTNEGKKRKRQVNMDFANAQPTLTHRAITKLVSEGIIHYCITQNVDGLHKRSGLSRQHHAVLHGCVFTERCEDSACSTEYYRDFDIGGMSFEKTGRKCERGDCQGWLRDTLLDWEDPLPEDDFDLATTYCEQADVAICLGTSLRIEPAGSLPTLAKKYVIVNLQETPYDKGAELTIRAKVDDVMAGLLEELGIELDQSNPPIERVWKPQDAKSVTNH